MQCEIGLMGNVNEVRTIVLVGRTGNGKSATGNSILGRKAFKSGASSFGVTSTCEMQNTVLNDGHTLNVIDTPGLFDVSLDANYIGKEMARCVSLAEGGIHAFILVFSVRTRFTEEEQATFRCLQKLFGPNLVNYMIVVYTGGDELIDNGQTLEDYIGLETPDPVKEILRSCKNRLVLFDNRTNNESRMNEQVEKLLAYVNIVIADNGGQPFSTEFFGALKDGSLNIEDQDQITKITEQVELRLGKSVELLEKQLAEEQAARVHIQQLAEMKLEEEKAARLKAELQAQSNLDEERAARLKAEQIAQQELAEELAARLKAEQLAKIQLEEERAARLKAEKLAEKLLKEEKAARLRATELRRMELAEARAARERAERLAEEARRKSNKICVIL